MNALDRAWAFRGFKKELAAQLGREEAQRIWREAGTRLAALQREHRDMDADSRMMILPAAALYLTQPGTLAPMRIHAAALGGRIARAVHAVTSAPGVSRLLWANMPALMRRMSSEKKGYRRRIVSETAQLVGVDILVCPLHEAAVRVGAREVASVVCAMDRAYMTGFRHIDYTRTTAIGEGDACCDYRLRYDPGKK